MHQKVVTISIDKVEQCTGFTRGLFPIKYLASLITYQRKRKEHYVELIDKVKGKLQAWKGKMLSVGGKEVLISSVL